MNRKILTPFLVGFLVVIVVACNDAKTTSEAPTPSDGDTPSTLTTKSTEAAKADAQSDTRAKQLDADIRAREQRNEAMGDQSRSDSDLASEVRSKLEANIPGGNLTVASKDGVVTVSGTVPNQDQVAKIKNLGMEIKGVKSITVKVVVSSQPKSIFRIAKKIAFSRI